jgi:NADH-quinone oxidoreductase subunit E
MDSASSVTHECRQQGLLLEALKEAQSTHGHLTKEVLISVAKDLGLPVAQVYSVATFYHFLRTAPKGKVIIHLCGSAPCRLAGMEEIDRVVRSEIALEPDGTSEEGLFSYELVGCIGQCDRAPAALLDNVPYGKLDANQVKQLLNRCREQNSHAPTK